MRHTEHSESRQQQRGIQQEVVDVLLEYGTRQHAKGGQGQYELCMDNRARTRARREIGQKAYAAIESRLNVYLIVDEATGCIITVAHRKRRRLRCR